MANTPDTSASLSAAPQSGLWHFGRAALDERLAALRVNGAAVALDRSGYDVLLALLRHAGEVVTKDELLDAGWPGRVVSENSLAKAISRLRQALGEDGEAIRVVHGYGYRLAAAVSFQPSAAESAVAVHDALRLREGDPLPQRPDWRLVRRLGQGSAGVAFLARSVDGKECAVKLATGEAGLRSLKREIALTRYIRAVKAVLPDVAQALDWNLSQPPFFLERPYFADGHLADWAAARGGLASLPLSERIALCAQLCETVAGIHEIGLIHKDLKPENLYPCVGADGRWRLVLADLGVGEALPSPRLAELGITMTLAADQVSQRAGSLLYLAPEVIAGEMPTQRSDVFALGVLLYQLAVGDLRRSLAPGWEADIDDELLREDIALAAASNPERRHVDARALAERLRTLPERRTAHAAARAQAAAVALQGQHLERLRQRRNVLWGVVAALSLGVAASALLYLRARQAEQQARIEAESLRAVNNFVNDDLLGAADPYVPGGGATVTVATLLDSAAARLPSRFDRQLAVRARLALTIARAYSQLGLEERARDVLETTLRDARGALDERSSEGRALLSRLAALNLKLARPAQAHTLYARLQRHAIAHLDPADPERLELARALAWEQFEEGRFEQARTALEALRANVRRLRPDDTPLRDRIDEDLAEAWMETQRWPQALDLLDDIIARYRRRDGADSVAALWPMLSRSYSARFVGRFDESEALASEVLRIAHDKLNDNHPTALSARNMIGTLRLRQGRCAEALREFEQARAAYRSIFGADNYRTRRIDNRIGETQICLGRADQARATLGAALTRSATALGEDHPHTLDIMRLLAEAEAADHAPTAAEARFRRVLALAGRRMPADNNRTIWTHYGLGRLLLGQGRTREAVAELRRAHALFERNFGTSHEVTRASAQWLRLAQAGTVAGLPLLRSYGH